MKIQKVHLYTVLVKNHATRRHHLQRYYYVQLLCSGKSAGVSKIQLNVTRGIIVKEHQMKVSYKKTLKTVSTRKMSLLNA